MKSDDINDEANGNCHYLILKKEDMLIIGKQKLADFLLNTQSVVLEKWCGGGVFYCWYDDMARQIRFGSVSDKHNGLPFRSMLNIKNEISAIVDIAFLYLDDNYFNSDISIMDVYTST